MIKNIIFDVMGVLINYDDYEYIRKFNISKEKIDQVIDIWSDKDIWNLYDLGKYTIEEIQVLMIKKYPKFETELKIILNKDWVKMHKLNEDVSKFLIDLKQKGYNTYILSNLSKEAHNNLRQYEFYNNLDGGVYSYQYGVGKPDKKIYEILINKFNFTPNECVFIDDRQVNLDIAKELGINTVLFKNIDQLKKEFDI